MKFYISTMNDSTDTLIIQSIPLSIAITCITCSSASQCLRDFRLSSGSFGSPVLATSVKLIQAETELSSLKTDGMMTAQ